VIFRINRCYFPDSVNYLIVVVETYFFCDVRTVFLNSIFTSFGLERANVTGDGV
jgi:hypothetical protein